MGLTVLNLSGAERTSNLEQCSRTPFSSLVLIAS